MPFKARVLEEWEGQHYTSAATVLAMHPSTLYRWRRDAGLEPVMGKKRAA